MKLLNLCDDILTTIINEVYTLRYNKMKKQFKEEWYNRRPYYLIFLSHRKIHEGRAFLETDLNKVQLIKVQLINI